MPLSWNVIRDRSLAFSREWADEGSEDAEAKSFWDGFFNVFGITRRRVASFEAPVKKGDGQGGFIDLLWKRVLLVEHKSRGKDLDRAARQEFLFERYQQLTAPLAMAAKPAKKARKNGGAVP